MRSVASVALFLMAAFALPARIAGDAERSTTCGLMIRMSLFHIWRS